MDQSNFYNIIHLSISFFLIFTSYSVTQTFQTSSDYAKDGAFAVGIIYLLLCISNAGLSSYIVTVLGVRSTLILSSLTYVSFIGSNIIYNKWALYISALLLGFGAAILWTAQGVYITVSTNKHEQVNNLVPSSTRGFMNGMFFGILQLNQIVGNLLVSYLFRLKFDQWIIFTVMTAIIVLGSISLFFVRPIEIPKTSRKKSILSSLSILLDTYFLLLIPTMCYNGLAQGFVSATIPPLIFDKSRKFLIFALYGGMNAFNFMFFGKLSDICRRYIFIFAIGAIAHLIVFGLLLTIWKPPLDQNRIEIFILLIIGLSIGDAIFGTLLYSIIGTLYGKTQPADAFASMKIFISAFTAIGFVGQVYFSIPIQILCLITLMPLSLGTLIYEHFFVVSLDTGKARSLSKKKNQTEVQFNLEEQLTLTKASSKA